MARNIITALDVGTSTVQTVVAERTPEGTLRILGMGNIPSSGVRRGIVIDLGETIASIRHSVQEAQKSAGIRVRSVWLAVGGTHVNVASSRGVVAVSRADQEISPEDVRRAIAAAETFIPKNPNREALHMIPRDFKVDNEPGIKDPVGMHGVRLEVDTLLIQCSTHFLKNLFKCVEGAGLRVEEYVFAPLAAAEAVLTKRQKELGVMLLDIGGGTASFVIFEEGVPIDAGVLPIGGNHITNDVAIGFRTHVDHAERIKCAYGSCIPDAIAKKDVIKLAEFVPEETGVYARRELAEIVEARMRDIFELLQKELKRIDRKQLLPAGIVMVGGSSVLPGIVELAKQELGLPAEHGVVRFGEAEESEHAASYAAAYGMLQWAYGRTAESRSLWNHRMTLVGQHKIVRWLKSLLP